jgi:acyl dehydratase
MLKNLEKKKLIDWGSAIGAKLSTRFYEVAGHKLDSSTHYPLNSVLYALSIGLGEDLEKSPNDLKFVYEGHPEFKPFIGMIGSYDIGCKQPELLKIPGFPWFPKSKGIHIEQITEFHRPISIGDKLRTKHHIVDIIDSKLGVNWVSKCEYVNDDDESIVYATIYITGLLIGLSAGGNKGTFVYTNPDFPKREPDFTLEYTTKKNQASLYRLFGLMNSIHIDPEAAKSIGLPKPVLHGMCTYGIIMRLILEKYCNRDQDTIKKTYIKMPSFVYPGDTLIVKCTEEGNHVFYQASTKERGKVVSYGYVEFQMDAKL